MVSSTCTPLTRTDPKIDPLAAEFSIMSPPALRPMKAGVGVAVAVGLEVAGAVVGVGVGFAMGGGGGGIMDTGAVVEQAGAYVGDGVGNLVGSAVGCMVGLIVGLLVGLAVGLLVGRVAVPTSWIGKFPAEPWLIRSMS